MQVTPNQIYSQVQGAIKALEKLPAKERESKPTRQFGRNYDQLLNLAKEAMPEVDARRWPPATEGSTAAGGQVVLDTRYTEIHSFLEQLLAILNEGRTYALA